jgi:hypothetical protein
MDKLKNNQLLYCITVYIYIYIINNKLKQMDFFDFDARDDEVIDLTDLTTNLPVIDSETTVDVESGRLHPRPQSREILRRPHVSTI